MGVDAWKQWLTDHNYVGELDLWEQCNDITITYHIKYKLKVIQHAFYTDKEIHDPGKVLSVKLLTVVDTWYSVAGPIH